MAFILGAAQAALSPVEVLSRAAPVKDPDALEDLSRALVRHFHILRCEPEETIRIAAELRDRAQRLRGKSTRNR